MTAINNPDKRIGVSVKKKPAIAIVISRENPPASETAAEIDRLAAESGLTVQAVGLTATRLGLPETERVLKQMTPKITKA